MHPTVRTHAHVIPTALAGIALLALCTPDMPRAYTYQTQLGSVILTGQTTGTPVRWDTLPVPITSLLGDPQQDAAVTEALNTWNALAPVFVSSTSAPTVVRWAAPGELPPTMAAWTRATVRAGRFVDVTILLDPSQCWDVYHGPLRFALCDGVWTPIQDLARVLLHELGHVLGLSHPDAAGQTVEAIMQSIESDLDALTADDDAGLLFLLAAYGHADAASSPSAEHASHASGGCALAPGSHHSDTLLLLGLLALLVGIRIARTRRSRS